MKIKNFYLTPIRGYQYISRMLPASCRYYPTCSEYASWQFECNTARKAFLSSSIRILRCNPLFKGGIDYPIITFFPQEASSVLTFNTEYGKINIIYWFIPKNKNNYYLVKDFHAIKRST